MLNYTLDLAKENPVNGYKFGCVITDKKGNKISESWNSYSKSHTLQFKYAKRVGREKAIYLHSEISALIRGRGQGHTMYVCRVDRFGKPAMAKPCPICQAAIKNESTIERVIYSINENEFGTLLINRN